jgi:hypothetical protein
MSTEDWGGFQPPPFQVEAALLQLRRSLADLKLSERSGGFELRGKRVLEVRIDGQTLAVRLARRLALTPQWDALVVKSSADQRKLIDEVKKRLARWDQED